MSMDLDVKRFPMRQRMALLKIERFETPEYGVIIEPMSTGNALVRRGLAAAARRRSFARNTGICLRLTDDGRAVCDQIEGRESK